MWVFVLTSLLGVVSLDLGAALHPGVDARSLATYETVIASDEAHYNGEQITLIGHVCIENAIGKVTAGDALLKRDLAGISTIDFPVLELHTDVSLTLAEGGILHCHELIFDYTQMASFFGGDPQVIYTDTFGMIRANRARIDYAEEGGQLIAKKIFLSDNVQLLHSPQGEGEISQYALADEVSYFPQEQAALLEGISSRVLFYDTAHGMCLSARKIRAQKDPVTQQESVHGFGDVHFVFGQEELEKIQSKFNLKREH